MKKIINVEVKIMEARDNGGRIVINTDAFDRDKDRVMPKGAQTENYMKNPVVQWGHNYRDPWATIGRTNQVSIFEDRIEVDFDLREPANDTDPQTIVRMLWNNKFINTASVGFMPVGDIVPNERGGFDFNSWELLEWSLVPIPANQEALRMAVKGFGDLTPITDDPDDIPEEIPEEKEVPSGDETAVADTKETDTEPEEPNTDDTPNDESEAEAVKDFFIQLRQALGENENE